MPRRYAYFTVAFAGAVQATATFAANNATPVAWEQTATFEADATLSTIAQPRLGTVQEAGIEVRVDGVAIPRGHLVGTIEVNRNRRELVQKGSFSIGLTEWGVSPLGDPFAMLGSPTGIKEIDYYGCYRNDATGEVFKVPLLKRTIAHDPTRESGRAGHVEHYTTLDPGSRWGRVPITLVLPPGHGIPEGRVARKALELAGETRFALQDGRRRFKELQLVDASAPEASQELFDVSGRTLYWDRNGYAVNPLLEPESYADKVYITEKDILSITTVETSFPADAVTKVIATGSEQIHEDEADAPCGVEATPDTIIKTTTTFKVWNAAFEQNAGCSLSAQPNVTSPLEQLETMTVTRQILRCGTVQREESESWAYFNPEVVRYAWSGGIRNCEDGVFLGAGAVANDANPAYRYQVAGWTMIGRTVKTHYYDAPGWFWMSMIPGFAFEPWVTILRGHAGDASSTGVYLGSITETKTWYNVENALKGPRTDPDTFADLPINTVKTDGNGTGRQFAQQLFDRTQLVVNAIQNSAVGYKEKDRTWTYGYAIVPNGSSFEYVSGATSADEQEQFCKLLDESTSYVPDRTRENTHSTVTVSSPLGKPTKTVSDGPFNTGPPASEYLPEYKPVPYSTQTEEEATFNVDATAGETKPIKVIMSADGLLATHLPHIVKTSFPYAEDEDELAAAATRIIRESLIIPISVTLSANWLLCENTPVNLTHRPIGINGLDCVINDITYTDHIGGQKTVRVNLERYPLG